MRTNNRLSALAVKHAGAGMHADGGNLYLRVAKGGSKQWIFRFELNGKIHDMSLGPIRFVNLAEARKAAAEARGLCYRGVNPLETRRARQRQSENEEVPNADETTLYRHFDADGNLLYVGISRRAFKRLCEHQTGSKWWLKIKHVVIEQFATRGAAEEAELAAIKIELPIYNRRHKPIVEIIGRV